MFNLKIAIRNLIRNGIYSGINVAGLAVSLTAVIIIALWVENEMTFDRWYSNTDNLYLTGISDEDEAILNSSEPLFKTLQTTFPEVKRVSHFMNDKDVILYTQDDEMNGFNDLGAWVDSTIFEMLDVKFIRGSAQVAFKPAFPIVLSEGLAKKLFGDEDPIGQTLRVNNYAEAHQVTGIFREQPKNTSFRFQWLMPFAVKAKRHADTGWNPENDWYTYYFKCWVELHPNADVIALNEKLKDIGNERMESDIFLYPVSRHYFYGEFADDKPVASKRVQSTLAMFPTDNPLEYAFVDDLVDRMFESQRQQGFMVALFSILSVLVSCLGLFGLVTYIAETKTKEIGIRKIHGASTGDLVRMLTKEFLILVAISSFVAFPLAYWWINQMLQGYGFRITVGWELYVITMLITLLLTLFTVGWQARKASTANPANAIKTE